MDVLDQRLQILNQAGLLSDEHVKSANALRDLFLKRYGITLTEENAAPFFTHFCMALHRLEAGETVQALDELILDELADEFDYDVAVFMADHGNDPTIGHPHHTREYVPLMVRGARLKPGCFGVRPTLSDVGATAADYFHAPAPENGHSFLSDILR